MHAGRHTGVCPRDYESSEHDRRGPLAKQGPRYGAGRLSRPPPTPQPTHRDAYERTKTRLGKQRGAKVAQVDLASRLAVPPCRSLVISDRRVGYCVAAVFAT